MSETNELAILPDTEIKTRMTGQKFNLFNERLNSTGTIEWIKEQIGKSKDGTIRVRAFDIQKELKMWKKPQTVLWEMKYLLFQHGIYVKQGTKITGEQMLVMRNVQEGDHLPRSLVDGDMAT